MRRVKRCSRLASCGGFIFGDTQRLTGYGVNSLIQLGSGPSLEHKAGDLQRAFKSELFCDYLQFIC